MEADHLLVFPAPRISSPVVGVCEAAQARFVSVIERRRARPGHLDDRRFPEYALPDSFRCRIAPQVRDAAYLSGRSRHKTGVIVVGELVHAAHERFLRHIFLLLPQHGLPELIRVSQHFLAEGVIVFLRPGQKPAQRFHKALIIHDRIPLFAPQPLRRIRIVLSNDDRLGIRFFDRFPESAPEFVVKFLRMAKVRRDVQAPSVRVVGR